MRHLWALLSVLLTLTVGLLFFEIGAQAEASFQREIRFNDTYRLASHLLADYQHADIMYRQLDVVNQALQDELNTRPLNQAAKPHRTF